MVKIKILYTTPIIEYPAAGGPELRIQNSIKALSKISDLYVVARCTKENMGGDYAVKYYSSLVNNFSFAPSINKLSKNRYSRKIQTVLRNAIKKNLARDLDFLLSIIEKENIDVVWFGFGNISFDLIKLLKSANINVKIVCDTDSVWSRFLLRELPYESDKHRAAKIKVAGLAKEKEEQEWVDLSDITTAVSEVDANYYKTLSSDANKIMLFSNVIDFNQYIQISSKPDNFISPSVYLAGSFSPKSAMDKAARWFIEFIYPIVKEEIPSIHFYIIGKGSIETLTDIEDKSITILGKVKTVLPYLKNSDVSIVPLKFESGTRFKIMEAAACKIPIVSTKLGAEGIPVKNGHDIIIADEIEEFAEAIIKIIKDKELAKNITQNCYNLINSNNSLDSLIAEGKNILKKLY